MQLRRLNSKSSIVILVFASLGITGAGAATIHRFTVTQTAGSNGATAFVQTAASASALQGEVASGANAGITIPFGVLGEYDAPGTTFGVGVAGVSTTGYAVAGEALGSNPAVIALNTGGGPALEAYANSGLSNATAIDGEAMNGVGVIGDSQSGNGIEGGSTRGYGVTGGTQSRSAAGVSGFGFGTGVQGQTCQGCTGTGVAGSGTFGVAGSGFGGATDGNSNSDIGVAGSAFDTTGIGGYFLSASGNKNHPALEVSSYTSGTDLFDAVVSGSDQNYYNTARITYPSKNTSGTVANAQSASSDFALNGDIFVSGNVYSNCSDVPASPASCGHELSSNAIHTSRGETVMTYPSHQASATMEDEGEAELVNGYAHIALDPKFATAISTQSPYLVFTTPQGDGPGLFVTHRTATGFDVRQSMGARGNMTFDYRIVAHPFADRSPRLASITTRPAVQPLADIHIKQIVESLRSREAMRPKNVPGFRAIRKRPEVDLLRRR